MMLMMIGDRYGLIQKKKKIWINKKIYGPRKKEKKVRTNTKAEKIRTNTKEEKGMDEYKREKDMDGPAQHSLRHNTFTGHCTH